MPTSGFLCVLILISHICAPSILLPVYPENNLITPFWRTSRFLKHVWWQTTEEACCRSYDWRRTGASFFKSIFLPVMHDRGVIHCWNMLVGGELQNEVFLPLEHLHKLYVLFPGWLQPLPSSSSSSGSALKPLHLAPPISPFISPQQTEPPSFQPQFHHHSLPINHPEYFYFANKMICSSLISSLQHLCVCVKENVYNILPHLHAVNVTKSSSAMR